jgi:hypothetical protein
VHAACGDVWFAAHSSCPVCRRAVGAFAGKPIEPMSQPAPLPAAQQARQLGSPLHNLLNANAASLDASLTTQAQPLMQSQVAEPVPSADPTSDPSAPPPSSLLALSTAARPSRTHKRSRSLPLSDATGASAALDGLAST